MGNEKNYNKSENQKAIEAERARQREIERKRQEEALEKKRQEAYEQKLIEEQRNAQDRNNEKLTSTVPSVTTEGPNNSYVTRDEKGKVTETKDENGIIRKFTWEGDNVASFTDEKGKQWSTKDGATWNAEGEKSRSMKVVVNAQDGTLGIVENLKKTDTLLNTLKDVNNRIVSGTDVNGESRKFEYNSKGDIVKFTDGNGLLWSTEDGKSFQNEKYPPRQMRISVNHDDATVSVTEESRLTMKTVEGKEMIYSKSGSTVKDKEGKIIAIAAPDNLNQTKLDYKDGRLKSITTSDGKTFTSNDDNNFSAQDGTTMRNITVTDSGKITYVAGSGDVMQIAPGKTATVITSKQTLETSARSIARAMNGGLTGAGTDRATVKAELDKLSEPAREELKRLWSELYKKGEANFDFATLDEEFADETSGSELEELQSKLNKKDGKEDVTGRVTTALKGLGEFWADHYSSTYEKNIRELIGPLDSKSIQEYEKEFHDKGGKGIFKTIQDDPNVSQTTKDAMEILVKGQDKRTDEDTIKLVDIALKGRNMDLLQETMRTASDKARKMLASDPTLQDRLEKAFSTTDKHGGSTVDRNKVNTANDYLKNGKLSVANEIKLNTSMGGDNEKAIDTALNQMTEQERVDYLKGKQLSAAGTAPSAMSLADREALNAYKDINSSLNAAGQPWEVNRWESKICNSKEVASFIDQLYAHGGSIYNSSVQDVSKTVEDMPEAVWKRLHEEQKEGKTTLRDQIITAYSSYGFSLDNEGKIKELTDIIDRKAKASTFEIAEQSGRRDIFTALKHSKGWLDDDETSGLKALQNMTAEEKEKYRKDPEFRARLDEAVKVFGRGVMDDAEYEAALKTLERVDNKLSTDDVLLDLYSYAQESSVNEADVIRRVQEAFRKDPTLFEKLKNPTTDAEKKYAEDFKAIMPKALGAWYDPDFLLYGKQLLETGHVDMFRSQYLNRGDFDDDEYGAYKSILYANKEQTEKLINDKEFRDHALHYLSEDEKSVAINNLKERDRQQSEISATQKKLDSAASDEEKAYLKERLELQRKELDKLYSGQMRPEDDIFASMLGAGTDEERLKNAISRIPGEDIHETLNNMSAKYNVSLPSELVSEMGGQDLAFALRNLRPKGSSQQEDFVYSLDEYSNSRGFGAEFVRVAWDGTADQTDKEFNEFAKEISNAYRLGSEMPEEDRRERMERLADRIDNLVESKEALGNVIADVTITAVAVVATCFGQPEAMGLLAFTSFAAALGLTGAAMKVAIKQAIMGNNYSSEMMYTDLATGFTDAAINSMGPGHISALLSVGKKTASRSAVTVTEKLLEKGLLKTVSTTAADETIEKTIVKGSKLVTVATENGAQQADKQILKEINGIVRDAMTSGAQKLDDRAIEKASLRLVDKTVGQEAYDRVLATGGKAAANAARQKEIDSAASKIAVVMKETLTQEIKLSQSTLQRYVTNASFNAANGSLAGGASGSLYAATSFDSSKSLAENLEMIAKAGLTSALIGGVTGGGMSTVMKLGSDVIPNLRKNSSELPQAGRIDKQYMELSTETNKLKQEMSTGSLSVNPKNFGGGGADVYKGTIVKTDGATQNIVAIVPHSNNQLEIRARNEATASYLTQKAEPNLRESHHPTSVVREIVLPDGSRKRAIVQIDAGEMLGLTSYSSLPEGTQSGVRKSLIQRMIFGADDSHPDNIAIKGGNIDFGEAFTTRVEPRLKSSQLADYVSGTAYSEAELAYAKSMLKAIRGTEPSELGLSDNQYQALIQRAESLIQAGKFPKPASSEEFPIIGLPKGIPNFLQLEKLPPEQTLSLNSNDKLALGLIRSRKEITEIQSKHIPANWQAATPAEYALIATAKNEYDRLSLELNDRLQAGKISQDYHDYLFEYINHGSLPIKKWVTDGQEQFMSAPHWISTFDESTEAARIADLQMIVNATQKAGGLDEIPVVLNPEPDHAGMIFKDGKIQVYVGSVSATAEESLSQLRRVLRVIEAERRMRLISTSQTLKKTVLALSDANLESADSAMGYFMDELLSEPDFMKAVIGSSKDRRWAPLINKAEYAVLGSWSQDEISQLKNLLETRTESLSREGGSSVSTASTTSATTATPVVPPMQVVSAGRLRYVQIGNETFTIEKTPGGEWFYPKGFGDSENVSAVKIHITTNSAEDLSNLQSALIPKLLADESLKSMIPTWKTLDVNHGVGLKAVGDSPTGFGQKSKGFTIYVRSPQDLESVASRLDQILVDSKLSLPGKIESGNNQTKIGSSNRVSYARDRWPQSENSSGQKGYLIDDLVSDSIKSELGIKGQTLSEQHLRYVEMQTGLDSHSLSLDNADRLMLRTSEKRINKAGLYASEADAASEFGKKTDRSALYALYRHYNLDPADVLTGKVTKIQLRGRYSPESIFPFMEVGNDLYVINSLAHLREKIGHEAVVKELNIIDSKYSLASAEAREELVDLLDDITSRWENDPEHYALWNEAITDFNSAAQALKNAEPETYAHVNAYLSDSTASFMSAYDWYKHSNAAQRKAATQLEEQHLAVSKLSETLTFKRTRELENVVNNYLRARGLPPTRIRVEAAMSRGSGSWADGVITISQKDILGGKAEFLSETIGHELLHLEQNTMIVRNLMDELNIGANAAAKDVWLDVADLYTRRLQLNDQTQNWTISYGGVDDILKARNGVRLSQEQRLTALHLERDWALAQAPNRILKESREAAKTFLHFAAFLETKATDDFVFDFIPIVDSGHFENLKVGEDIAASNTLSDAYAMLRRWRENSFKNNEPFDTQRARELLINASKRRAAELRQEGMVQYSAYAGKIHEWDAYFHGYRIREVAEEAGFRGSINNDKTLFELDHDPYATGDGKKLDLVSSRTKPPTVNVAAKIEDSTEFEKLVSPQGVDYVKGFRMPILRKQNDGVFRPTAAMDSQINTDRTDSFVRNCRPCTFAVFKSITSGDLVTVDRVWWDASSPSGGPGAIKALFERTFDVKTNVYSGADFTYADIPDGHYALFFDLDADGYSTPLFGVEHKNYHVVYLRKSPAGVAVYDPQGDYFYDAFGLDEIAKRKPLFMRANFPDSQKLYEIPTPDSAIFVSENISELADAQRAKAAAKPKREPEQSPEQKAVPYWKTLKEIAREKYGDILETSEAREELEDILEYALARAKDRVSKEEYPEYERLVQEWMRRQNDRLLYQVLSLFTTKKGFRR